MKQKFITLSCTVLASITSPLAFRNSWGMFASVGMTSMRRKGTCSRIQVEPNQVPVTAPQTIVAIARTMTSMLVSVHSFWALRSPSPASRKTSPYPPSPMIIAKKTMKKSRNGTEISRSR